MGGVRTITNHSEVSAEFFFKKKTTHIHTAQWLVGWMEWRVGHGERTNGQESRPYTTTIDSKWQREDCKLTRSSQVMSKLSNRITKKKEGSSSSGDGARGGGGRNGMAWHGVEMSPRYKR